MNLIVLFHGTECSRTAMVFPIWCHSKPRVEATKQLAIRLSALPIRSLGIYTVAQKDSDREKYEHTHTSLSRQDFAFRCVVTIAVSRWTAAHSFRRPGNRYVYPTVPKKPFGYIDRTDVENVSTLQRFARFSYLSSSRILFSRCYFFRENNDIGLTMTVSVCLS